MSNLVGNIPKRFKERTEAALSRAGTAHNSNPFERVNTGSVPPPNLRTPLNQTMTLHMISETPTARNMGTSANIVIDPEAFNQATKRMDSIDEFVGQEVYTTLCEVEEMCETIFQIPETIARIKDICSEVKRCLGPFRGVTDGVVIDTRKYVSAMSDVDHGNAGLIALSQVGVNNAVQVATTTINRQAHNMEQTSLSYKTNADRLEREAEREQLRADRLQMQIDASMANI